MIYHVSKKGSQNGDGTEKNPFIMIFTAIYDAYFTYINYHIYRLKHTD